MKIDDIVDQLAAIRKEHGNLECLIEVDIDDGALSMMRVGELSLENRDYFGDSVLFIC